MFSGSGEPGKDEFHSFVLYHSNSPRWSEQIKLCVPPELFRLAHLRFEFRHCSSKSSHCDCLICAVSLKIKTPH